MAGPAGQMPAMMLAVAVGALLAGCVDQRYCWTKAHYLAAAESPPAPIREIQAGTFPGEVVTENPRNWWTNARFTGKACHILVEHRADGTYAETQFMDAAARLQARMGPGDSPFFAGETADGKAIVLQHHLGRPVSLTLTAYGVDGVLPYGGCGEGSTPYLECQSVPRRAD